jgi:ribonucleoside-diphosphate reductase alpha chain
MVILNADHPDIVDFINCKVEEEKKAWALIDAGYDGSFTGTAYSSVFFQNSNNSVRVTDEFMRAVLDDGDWQTRAVTSGAVMDNYKARDLMRLIAEGTHSCGDPGMQFDTTVNEWHTCATTARINASNPCSEYMFLDDSACNLASINLMKFVDAYGEFEAKAFKAAVRTLSTAQEIIVDNASYPTKAIERNSHDFRPLGLGYANLGALLMARGLPYDSDGGRDYSAAITALMTGEAYAQSARIARDHDGPFAGYELNRESFLRVMRKHRDALRDVSPRHVPADLYSAAKQSWDDAVKLGEAYGYRNAQATVLAPTGTIGFMMDCDTTGVEPDIALVKYKKLVGGGLMKIVNQTVPMALARLGYGESQINAIVEYIDEHETIEGAPGLKEQHLPVFDCAFRAAKGQRSIHYTGHIKMMGAAQPFISGAISKTVNVPKDATVEE